MTSVALLLAAYLVIAVLVVAILRLLTARFRWASNPDGTAVIGALWPLLLPYGLTYALVAGPGWLIGRVKRDRSLA
jgi:hypothetical protein